MLNFPTRVPPLLPLLFPLIASAQTPPTSRPVAVPPPGFVVVTAGLRTAWCDQADRAWVEQVLAATPPATQPTTTPARVLEQLTARRDELVAGLTKDLALPDPSAATKLLDEVLLPAQRNLADRGLPVTLLVATRARLTEAVRGGWELPGLTYNRLTGDVSFDLNVAQSRQRPDEDLVLPASYAPTEPDAERRAKLAAVVDRVESLAVRQLTNATLYRLQSGLHAFVVEQFKPLALADDQRWLAGGTAGYLSAHYTAVVTGTPFPIVYEATTHEDRRTPVLAAGVDLLHPRDASLLRPQMAAPYADAFNRKATAAVNAWVAKAAAGRDVIGLTVNALRAAKPADGPSLVKLIRDTTGVDVTPELLPK